MDEISKQNFASWKRDMITVKLLDHLQEILKGIEIEMMDPALIMRATCQAEQCQLLGYKTCIQDILELTSDDLSEKTE